MLKNSRNRRTSWVGKEAMGRDGDRKRGRYRNDRDRERYRDRERDRNVRSQRGMVDREDHNVVTSIGNLNTSRLMG